jgi:prepilin-type processing-associated H-X9-DG protein
MTTYSFGLISESEVTRPAETVTFADPPVVSGYNSAYLGWALDALNYPQCLPNHHNGTGVYAFADGHAKSLGMTGTQDASKLALFNVYK